MQNLKTSIIANFLLLTICGNLFSQQQEPKSTVAKNVTVIELNGNGYQRGLEHGKLLKTEIAEVYKKWKDDIAKDSGQDADSIIHKFYRSTNFEPAIKKWTPEIYDEVKGIAESSGQSFKDVYCFQLVDEFWVYLDELSNKENHHCSGIGVGATKNSPAYIAQNLDIESFRNGYQVLLHVAANKAEPEQYILSCAGLIALNGVNSKSIGLTLNTLMQLKASTDGLPVSYIIRGVLAKNDAQSAISFLKTIKHASGQNYILGAVDKVYDFEASANKVERYIPDASNPSLVYHTNHPIKNNDVKPWYAENLKKVLSGENKDNNSLVRFLAVQSRMNTNATSQTADRIKATLRSKDNEESPICKTYDETKSGFTFSSVLFTLGKKPSIQLTNGSPDQSEYVLHSFHSIK